MPITLDFQGGKVTLHSNRVNADCVVVSAVKGDPEGWERFTGEIAVSSWLPMLETAYHLIKKNNQNPEFISRYVNVDMETANKLAQGIRENIDAEILRRFEPLRMCRIKDGRKSVELYKPTSKDANGALMFTDGAEKKRSRILLNDLSLKALYKGIQRFLNGSVILKSDTDDFVIFSRKNDRISVTTSTGYSKELSAYERFLLSASLENFPENWEVRPFSYRNLRALNRNGKAYIGVSNLILPLDKNAIKLFLILQ